MVSMSYYGAEKAVPGYNVMGVAKAALEATTRYLAMELGERNIRVNAISGGPIRTMSSMAVGGFSQILDWVEQKAPLKRNVTGEDVGDAAAWLLSPRASASLPELAQAEREAWRAGGVTLLIGPEGGLSPEEEDRARRAGFIGVSLGPRILRTETAGLTCLATLNAILGGF